MSNRSCFPLGSAAGIPDDRLLDDDYRSGVKFSETGGDLLQEFFQLAFAFEFHFHVTSFRTTLV